MVLVNACRVFPVRLSASILCHRAEGTPATAAVANKTRHDCLMHVAPHYYCLSVSTP